MIFSDLSEYRAANFHPKVCVIGAGPAGITVARTLAKLGIPVVLLNAGDEEYSEESQDFYRGATVGDYYFDLDVTRQRHLGGSSNHWMGWCRPLDAHDFTPKVWVPDSGWPITRAAIEPFLGETQDILDLVPLREDLPVTSDIRWIQLIKSPAVRFAEKYRVELARSDCIAVVLNSYVTELAGNGRAVTGAKVMSRGQPPEDLLAEQYVLCTGGLENSRLLLWSNERSGGAVVPYPATLGRYWMEHPQFFGGDALGLHSDAFEMDADNDIFFSPSPEAMEREQILNFQLRLVTTPYTGAKGTVASLACVAPSAAEWLSASMGMNLTCAARISVGWEQAPYESNRVALSATERDPAGVPRIELHWKKQELERRTLLEGVRMFGRSLAATDLGRIRIDDWLRNGEDYPDDHEIGGHHHMGGTRMSDDPARGIVDGNCRVHGMANLYVGGSSVFTTSGHANPTTTIVALALRLGYHLARQPGLAA